IVYPDNVYFGQKDAQQARIVQQMVRDLDVPVRVRVCPIVREPDGLALSSRNQYLDPNQRRHATVLYQALEEARQRIENGERDPAIMGQGVVNRIRRPPGPNIDYVELAHADSLRQRERLKGPILIAVAVKFGTTRLIDNIRLHIPGYPAGFTDDPNKRWPIPLLRAADRATSLLDGRLK